MHANTGAGALLSAVPAIYPTRLDARQIRNPCHAGLLGAVPWLYRRNRKTCDGGEDVTGFYAELTPNSIGWVNVLLLVQYNMPNNH